MLDAAAALWDCDSRFVGAGGESAIVAGVVDGFSATGRSGGDSRGEVRGWISGRAVRAAGGGRVGAVDAQFAVERRDDYVVGGRSVESGGDPGAGGKSAGDFWSDGELSGWGGGGGGVECGGQRGGGVATGLKSPFYRIPTRLKGRSSTAHQAVFSGQPTGELQRHL